MTFPDDWAGKFTITSDNTKVAAGVKGLAYDLSLAPAEFWTNVKSDGSDIRITSDAEGTTLVARDVISIDTTAETGLIRIDTSGISTSADTNYYLWAGNASATEPSPSDTYGQYNAYYNNRTILHLEEGSGSTTTDRGNYENDGVLESGASWITDSPSFYKNSVFFGTSIDGTDRVRIPGSQGDSDWITSSFTILMWFRCDQNNSQNSLSFDNIGAIQRSNSGEIWRPSRGSAGNYMSSEVGEHADGQWHFLQWSHNGNTGNSNFVINGVLQDTASPTYGSLSANTDLYLGSIPGVSNRRLIGAISYFAFLAEPLSIDQGTTLYNNESDNTFWTTGAWDEDVGLTITTLTPINITQNSVTLRGEVANFE